MNKKFKNVSDKEIMAIVDATGLIPLWKGIKPGQVVDFKGDAVRGAANNRDLQPVIEERQADGVKPTPQLSPPKMQEIKEAPAIKTEESTPKVGAPLPLTPRPRGRPRRLM